MIGRKLIETGRMLRKFFPHPKGKTCYSQCGEDIIVEYILNSRGVTKPSYLDVGAYHPFYISNTALFYKKGGIGVNVEANPALLRDFNIYRSRDKNINFGVSDVEGKLDFYIFRDHTLSTFSRQEAEKLISVGKPLESIQQIEVITINTILSEFCHGVFPDFLSLDVEGKDYDILNSIDFSKTFPKIICVETAEYSINGTGKANEKIKSLLISSGYFEYAHTNLNSIMVRRDFWYI